VDDPVWDATDFSKNRDRLLDGAIAAKFLDVLIQRSRDKGAALNLLRKLANALLRDGRE
jgi:hypothetical protein